MEFKFTIKFDSVSELLESFANFPDKKTIDQIHCSTGITQYLSDTYFNSVEITRVSDEKVKEAFVFLKQDNLIKKIKLYDGSVFYIKFK